MRAEKHLRLFVCRAFRCSRYTVRGYARRPAHIGRAHIYIFSVIAIYKKTYLSKKEKNSFRVFSIMRAAFASCILRAQARVAVSPQNSRHIEKTAKMRVFLKKSICFYEFFAVFGVKIFSTTNSGGLHMRGTQLLFPSPRLMIIVVSPHENFPSEYLGKSP